MGSAAPSHQHRLLKGTEMRYQHDCDNCKPLGEHGDADLYFCDQGGAGITVIARYSSDGADYTSGLCAAPFVPDLSEAKNRAIASGLLTPKQEGPRVAR